MSGENQCNCPLCNSPFTPADGRMDRIGVTRDTDLLYHATYNTHLQSIKELGLGGKQLKNWEFSKDGTVYFAQEPYEAESYAEAAEEVSEKEFESGITILAVMKKRLDISLLRIDENNRDNTTLEYAGIIPADNIFIWKKGALWAL